MELRPKMTGYKAKKAKALKSGGGPKQNTPQEEAPRLVASVATTEKETEVERADEVKTNTV